MACHVSIKRRSGDGMDHLAGNLIIIARRKAPAATLNITGAAQSLHMLALPRGVHPVAVRSRSRASEHELGPPSRAALNPRTVFGAERRSRRKAHDWSLAR